METIATTFSQVVHSLKLRRLFSGGCLYKTMFFAAEALCRGGAEQFIAEAERSLHDAIMVVRRAVRTPSVVAGGGAIEVGLL